MTRKLQISLPGNHGDIGGVSFSAPPEALDFVGHLSAPSTGSAAPGPIGGNHDRRLRCEAIGRLPGTPRSFDWDKGEAVPAQHGRLHGSGAVLVPGSTGAARGVRDDGRTPRWLVAISPAPDDRSESVDRKVV